jgi:DNA-binding beta-propeller fold protein YncE
MGRAGLVVCWCALALLGACIPGTPASQELIYLPDVEVCDLVSEDTGVAPGTVWQPMGCAILDKHRLAFVDTRNQIVRTLDKNASRVGLIAGNGVKSHMDGAGTNAGFFMPYSITTPPITPTPYAVVADYGNKCIRNISFETYPAAVSSIACDGLITSPSDTAISPAGDIYITDPISHTVLLYTAAFRTVERVAGMPNASGFADGAALTEARFHQPLGIAVHAFTGRVYVADWLNDAVRVISNGTVSTLLGGPQAHGLRDGTFASALLHGPKMVGCACLLCAVFWDF